MAAKRYIEADDDEDQPKEKRMKTKPSFASVIREVVMVNFLENFCSAVEPVIRRVVGEEVEDGLRRCSMSSLRRGPVLQIEQTVHDHQATGGLRLAFAKRLSTPIFTGTKIVDVDNNPLQIILVDGNGGIAMSIPFAIKVDIVVLDGDFPSGDHEWTADEFAKNIVKERTGKRPLLTGDLNITMRDQGVGLVGDIEFTDNSSWIRSRKFRVGARVQQLVGNHRDGVVIREAMTEPFVVKDHRGELYKKHHPPALEDNVWRLEKIGKGGAFHQKLASEGINTVQDFLKLFNVDPPKLRRILGIGMSEKMWEATLKHAKTCLMGNKVYRSRGNNYTLILSPFCQVINAEINGQVYSERDFKRMHTGIIDAWVKDAYSKWNSLEEVDVQVPETPLLTQGDEVLVGHHDGYPSTNNNNINDQQLVARTSSNYVGGQVQNNGDYHDHTSYNGWASPSGYYLSSSTSTPHHHHHHHHQNGFDFISESSSEGYIP